MKKIETILFDFDGTIMDTNDVIMRSWQHTFLQVRGAEGDEKTILATFGEPLEQTMRNFFGGDDAAVRKHLEIYRSYQKDRFLDLIHLFPGVQEMLEAVRASGLKPALVTSRLKSSTMEAVEKFDLARFFDVIITADDVTTHKPDPQPIFAALEKLGSLPGNALMIGDTKLDILCARNAGVRSVLVDWSVALPEGSAADEYLPDHHLKHPEDLMDLISSINDMSTSEPEQ